MELLKDKGSEFTLSKFIKNNEDKEKDKLIKEQEMMAKDQVEEVPENPYKLGQDLEKQHLANTDGGNAFKNVGDSTNDQGDEIPKRNLTSDEEELLNLYHIQIQ